MFAFCLNGQNKSHDLAQSQCSGQMKILSTLLLQFTTQDLQKRVSVRIQAWMDMKKGTSSGVALHSHLTWEQLDILIG